MYYPFLRGRQFELIALREYASEYKGDNKITPIIELVKKTFNNVKLALPKLIAGNVKFALILNPKVGDIDNSIDILEELKEELKDISKWIPALIVTNDYIEIEKYIVDKHLLEVMLICTERTDTSNPNFERLMLSEKIKYIVSEENKSLKRSLAKSGKKGDKQIIRLDDKFKPLQRNKDYLEIGEEKFTEEHMFFEDDGYNGFSDYTVLRSDFLDGGGAAWAVSIHLTYKKQNEEIWIKHFTSDTNDSIANIQGKFAEAAKKAVNFLNSEGINTNSADELRKYVEEAKYPGLGMVKKISIKNHLELINNVLN